MDAEFFGKKIGTATNFEWFEGIDQYHPFKAAEGVCLPDCDTLEIDSVQGVWRAYGDQGEVIKHGRLFVVFEESSVGQNVGQESPDADKS